MGSFDPTAPGALTLFVLLAMRVGGVLLVAPVFSARSVPMSLRAALLVLFTLALVPVAGRGAAEAPELTVEALFSEMLVGFAMGLGAAVFIGAAEVAGEVVSLQTGFSSAEALDPQSQVHVPTLGQFAQLLAVTLILSTNGHLALLEALASSAEAVPVGGGAAVERGLEALVSLGGTLFALGLRFAAPVVAAVLLSQVALGVLARTAPQLNVLVVALPVQIWVGVLALAASLPLLAEFFSSWASAFESVVMRLLDALQPGPVR